MAQTQTWNFPVSGRVTKGGKKMDGAVVSLIKDGVQVKQTITTSNGKFDFVLDPNANYTITVTKANHITKIFSFNTQNVPDSRGKKGFGGVDLSEIVLFEIPKGVDVNELNAILSQPIAKFSYQSSENDFNYDESYTQSMRSKLEKLSVVQKKAEEEDKKKLEEDKNKATADANAASQAAAAKAAADKAAADKAAADKLAAEKAAKAAADKVAADKLAAEKAAADKAAADKVAADKLAAEKAAKAAADKAAADKLAAEKAAADKMAADKLAADKAAADKLAAEKAAKAAADKAAADKLAAEKAAADKMAADKLAADKAAADKLAAEKAAADKAAADKLAAEKAAADKAAADKLAADKAAADKLAAEKAAADKTAADKLAADKAAKAAADKTAADKLAADKAAKEKELNDKYNAAIVKGDKGFAAKDYLVAKAAYNEAAGIKTEEAYPRNKLVEIEKILTDIANKNATEAEKAAREKEINDKYVLAITKANKFFDSKDYPSAKAGYNEALSIKPAEQLPKDRLAEIKKIEEQAAADKAAKDKEMADKLAADKAARDAEMAKKEKYKGLIENADKQFLLKQYKSAKPIYQEALTLMPDEKYPKDKITVINDLLAKEKTVAATKPAVVVPAKVTPATKSTAIVAPAKDADPEVKKQYVNALVSKYPQGVTEEKSQEGNCKIVKLYVVKGSNAAIYRKSTWAWGQIFYFKDDVPITEAEFNSEAQ